MSLFFIKRPNFAWVVALFISLAGLLAIPLLPVAQYPSVAPPQITVTATYPGASAQVLVDSVTSVIEEELNGAKGLLYFESTSNSNGMAEVVVTFQPGTNPELAQVDVQNRLKKAEARLPQAVLTRAGGRADQRRLPADLRAQLQGRLPAHRHHGAGRLRRAQHQQRAAPRTRRRQAAVFLLRSGHAGVDRPAEAGRLRVVHR